MGARQLWRYREGYGITELEKLQRAKMYMDKLANGIDPVSDADVPDDSALNNVRLSRCFFYVSDILRQVIENGGSVAPVRHAKKADFELTEKQRAEIPYSKEPIAISQFTELINGLIDINTMKKLPITAVTTWMVANGFLSETANANGNKKKVPTAQGNYIGLTLETRQGVHGEYTVVLYDENAQQFVIDHLDAIVQSHRDKAFKHQKGEADASNLVSGVQKNDL